MLEEMNEILRKSARKKVDESYKIIGEIWWKNVM
jgi:hypothetical protein